MYNSNNITGYSVVAVPLRLLKLILGQFSPPREQCACGQARKPNKILASHHVQHFFPVAGKSILSRSKKRHQVANYSTTRGAQAGQNQLRINLHNRCMHKVHPSICVYWTCTQTPVRQKTADEFGPITRLCHNTLQYVELQPNCAHACN